MGLKQWTHAEVTHAQYTVERNTIVLQNPLPRVQQILEQPIRGIQPNKHRKTDPSATLDHGAGECPTIAFVQGSKESCEKR
jgi:hypothetical protein